LLSTVIYGSETIELHSLFNICDLLGISFINISLNHMK
jgi:hypothetical protein